MGLDELRALIALLRESGITHYSADGVTLDLGRAQSAQPAAEPAEREVTPTEAAQAGMDLLMRSSGSSVRLVPKAPKVAG